MAVISQKHRLYLDFYCYLPGGSKVRCREATGLTDNKKNREIARSKDKAIKYHLKNGSFDYLKFFPHGSKAKCFRGPTEDMAFSKWWEEWLNEKSIRPNTVRNWNSAYRVHIGPHFGHYNLSQITEHEILVFRRSLLSKGLKESSINDKVMKVLCMALYRAYKRGKINEYPCKDISRLEEQPVDIDPFSFEELRHFLNTLMKKNRPEYHDLIFIWSRTGLRPGELYALRWRNVDYFNAKMMIRQTRWPSGTEGPPKTKHSIRDVDLRPPVIDALKRQEARTGLMDSYVFMTEAQKPFSDAFMRKKFRFLLKLAKLKYRPPKQMRHTFATLHLAAGENISWVSRMLGHSSGEITWKRYNRYVRNLTREDGSAFERVMEGPKSEDLVNQQV